MSGTISCTVSYYGSNAGAHGYPEPFYRYFIVASPWQLPDSGVATVMPLGDEPALNPPHFVATTGGPQQAIKKAVSALDRRHSGLQKLTDCPE